MRKAIYLVPPPIARISSEVTVSGAVTAPQPASTHSATGDSVESDTPPAPPAYDHDGGLEMEHVDVLEKT